MTSVFLPILLLATLPYTTLATPVRVPSNHSTPFSWPSTHHVLAFGDSYTYAQGTLGYANSTFIGSNLNFSYTPSQLLSDRIVQEDVNSTANRGANWIEVLTGCGIAPGLTNPQDCAVQLWDFAFGGADVSAAYLPLHHNWSVQLVNQTQEFLLYAEPTLRSVVGVDPASTLVAFWIGINDIGDSAKLAVDFPSYYDGIIATMFSQVVSPVYDAGYRHFLFMNLPPLDRTPSNLVRAAGPLPNKTMIGWWDDALEQHRQEFEEAKGDVTAMLFDANAFLNGVLDEPGKYGITNTTGYCAQYDQPLPVEQYGCLSLWEYFWYNTGHMTTHTHRILGEEVGRFLGGQGKP